MPVRVLVTEQVKLTADEVRKILEQPLDFPDPTQLPTEWLIAIKPFGCDDRAISQYLALQSKDNGAALRALRRPARVL